MANLSDRFTDLGALNTTPPPDSMIRLSGGNGHGGSSSGESKVRNFDTAHTSVGSAITYTARTTTTGDKFTINEDGVYAISYSDRHLSSTSYFGASLNSAQLTTNIQGITDADRLFMTLHVNSQPGHVGGTYRFSAGDVVRAHTNGTQNDTADPYTIFSITQVAKT